MQVQHRHDAHGRANTWPHILATAHASWHGHPFGPAHTLQSEAAADSWAYTQVKAVCMIDRSAGTAELHQNTACQMVLCSKQALTWALHT